MLSNSDAIRMLGKLEEDKMCLLAKDANIKEL